MIGPALLVALLATTQMSGPEATPATTTSSAAAPRCSPKLTPRECLLWREWQFTLLDVRRRDVRIEQLEGQLAVRPAPTVAEAIVAAAVPAPPPAPPIPVWGDPRFYAGAGAGAAVVAALVVVLVVAAD